jgi:hypothetical protein
MRWLLRTAAVSSFVAALGALGVFAYPSLANDVGELWHVMDDQERIRAAEESNSRIDREAFLIRERIALKDEVVRDLLDGRIGFDEAAERFAEMNRMQPSALKLVRLRFPGQTDEERAAWQLLNYVRRSTALRDQALADDWECRLRGRS